MKARLACTILISLLVSPCACTPREPLAVKILSRNLSHRIVVLDTVETRLKLMVGFSLAGRLPSGPKNTRAQGLLSHQGIRFAYFTAPRLDHAGGNLVFYLPYRIPPGDYDLLLELSDIPSGSVISRTSHTIRNIETVGAREGVEAYNWMRPLSVPLRNPPDETLEAPLTKTDRERGYILWHRHPFRYVYPNSAPGKRDVISELSVKLARDEYEPVTFSLYALQDVGQVRLSITEMVSDQGALLPPVEVHVVDTVPRLRSMKGDAYEMRPRLLRRQNTLSIEKRQSRRFWLTVHASPGTEPSQYRGALRITTDLGRTEIPLTVEVLPFALLERPDKEYGFDMTYVFQEMTAQDLTAEERAKLYENGVKTYRSFHAHGLTTVIPHSPFVFRRSPDGNPDLRDLQAAVKAFGEVGFTGPFVYYCGHLVQNAKPGWAGSTCAFDARDHPALMKEIISYARSHFPGMQSMDVHWMPGDEVQDDRGGPNRMRITGRLLRAIREMDEKAAISVWSGTPWAVAITLGGPTPKRGEHWQYPNEDTTVPSCVDDAEGMRRAFGLQHVKSPYVGIAPWTFQTSQNASGDPYTDLDASTARPEVMVAYPGVDGPMPTPEYEALREGIDDGRYAYVLETRIKTAMHSDQTALQQLGRQAEAAYQAILGRIETAGLEQMDQDRHTMVEWILRLGATEGPAQPIRP
jgi:hypothetical protein